MAYRTLFLATTMTRQYRYRDRNGAQGHHSRPGARSRSHRLPLRQKGQVATQDCRFCARWSSIRTPASLNNLSILQLDVGRFDESLSWARRAFHLAPNSFLSYYHVGAPLIWLGDDEVSHLWLSEANRRFPTRSRIIQLTTLLKWCVRSARRPGGCPGSREGGAKG